MSKISIFMVLFAFLFSSIVLSQTIKKDKAIFQEDKKGFWDQIKTEIANFDEKKSERKTYFKMDFSGMDLPDTTADFTYQWHNNPVSQGKTGCCWCFATTSFFESEIYRLHKKEVKLSEMYTVYWEYVEKARRFIKERGDSRFEQGSLANAVTRIWKKYGIMPEEAYTGKKPGQKFHNHSKMEDELYEYLKYTQNNNIRNEDDILANVKSILNYYLGEPPLKIIVDREKMTPLEYLENKLELNLDDYIDVFSLKEKEYYKKVECPVPDNWWHNADYYNVPLDEFMQIIKKGVRSGYTMSIDGDVSSAGHDSYAEVSMIPTFDIPSEYIDDNARQLRFSNKSTTDDHLIHIVGYMEKDGADWYLIKDSGSGAFNGKNKGYRFFHEDYVKLKMISYMIHKDVVEDLLKKFK